MANEIRGGQAAAPECASPDFTDRKWESFQAWNKRIHEQSALQAMQFLKEVCADYNSALSKARDDQEDAKNRLYEKNKSNLDSIKRAEATAVETVVRQSQEAYRAVNGIEDSSLKAYSLDLGFFLDGNKQKFGLRKLVGRLAGGFTKQLEKAESDAFQREKDTRTQLGDSFAKQRAAQAALRDAQLEQIKAEAELNRAKESASYNEEFEQLQSAFRKRLSEMDAHFRSVLRGVASDAQLHEYRRMVLSSVPSAAGYACSTGIPAHVYLGDACLEIAHKSAIHPEVSQCISEEAARALDPAALGKLTARLPYCQSLAEGISLFLNYSPSERGIYQEMLRMLLLKLFMAFPAGKLEAVMIDPLELGETFAMFTKLGEEQPRIIDTKIWSQEKDIGESINILRQKLETMTQSYGSDKETRLKKEPVRVLAITDFPTGFSQSALRDLQAIVRKSASYGVCIFIWANSQEIAKLQASQQSVFNEIKQMLHVATAKGSVLELQATGMSGVTLVLDPMREARENSAAVIQTIARGIHESQRKIERFVDMFDNIEDPNNWFSMDSVMELSIPVGIKGANTIVKMAVGRKDGSTAHHALIAGQTGAGKSTLLHTIIMSTMLNYSPDEAQMYLVDFKEGVEFKTYTRFNLPSLRVVAIDSEREFGLNILSELCKELERRADLFTRAGYEEISDYRRATGQKVPKIVMIFDEVQELFRDGGKTDGIVNECIVCLGKLVTLGRALGIHVVLACQDFKLIPCVQPLFTSMAIRIAIKGSEDSARSVLGDSNAGAKQLQDGAAGSAVFNDASGKESANVVFQVGYLEKGLRMDFLSKLNAFQNSEALARKYNSRTRILLTNAEDDIFNVFNQLAIHRKIEMLYDDDRYCLLIGEGFELSRKFRIGVAPKPRGNLLMIGSEEKSAASLFYFSMLSLLYGELGNKNARKNDQLIYFVDLSVEDAYATPDNTCFAHLTSLFPKQIRSARMGDMEDLICTAYDTLLRRMERGQWEERLFLLFFGISRAHRLMRSNMYEDRDTDEMSSLTKLQEIIRHGARYGMSCILWGETAAAASKIIGTALERDFAHRIVFSSDGETMERLTMEHSGSLLRHTTAIYMNVDEDVKNTHFRPYEIPARIWVEKIANAYREFEEIER